MKSIMILNRKSSILLLGFFAFCSVAPSSSFAVPKKKPAKTKAPSVDQLVIPPPQGTKPAEVVKKDLPHPTLIKHYSFTVLAPKDWSVLANGWSAPQDKTSDFSDAMVTLTPEPDSLHDTTFLSIRTLYGKELPETIEDLFAIVSRDQTKQTRYVKLKGQRWIFSQWETQKSDGTAVKNYSVRTIVGTRGFLALSETPMATMKTLGSQLLKILQSVEVNPK